MKYTSELKILSKELETALNIHDVLTRPGYNLYRITITPIDDDAIELTEGETVTINVHPDLSTISNDYLNDLKAEAESQIKNFIGQIGGISEQVKKEDSSKANRRTILDIPHTKSE